MSPPSRIAGVGSFDVAALLLKSGPIQRTISKNCLSIVHQCRKMPTQKFPDTLCIMLPKLACRDKNRRHFALSATCRRHYQPSFCFHPLPFPSLSSFPAPAPAVGLLVPASVLYLTWTILKLGGRVIMKEPLRTCSSKSPKSKMLPLMLARVRVQSLHIRNQR